MAGVRGSMSAPSPPDSEREVARLKRRLARERRARDEAENLLMSKSRELYDANSRLAEIAESLEKQVDFKTLELLNAQRLARFGTLIWDIRAELITWSEGIYHVLGVDSEQEALTFERYLSLVHPEDRERIAQYIQESVDDMLELHREYRVEHRVITPRGEVRWIRGYAEAVSRGEGEIEYVIGAVRDVTADKLAEIDAEENRRIIEARVRELEQTRDELASARDAAQAASKTKSRFLAMMSHEIRTPMNGILGTLHMLEDTQLDGDQKRIVDTARASGENLRTILNDILDLSKMEAGRLELEEVAFGFVSSIEGACRFWQPLADQKGLALNVRIDESVPEQVKGDSARIRQIVNNLVSNAIKFTFKGEITVRVDVEREHPSAVDGRTSVIIEVQDTGVGIPRNKQRLLFREFSQLGEPGASGASGTGLGLAISRQLATLMDGSMGVTSAEGVGSCFWLRLPLQAVESESARQGRSHLVPLSQVFGRRPRVLLAEDVPTNQMIAEHMVTNFDCSVEIAANGLFALEAVSERPFDIVLMDVSMPEMDGVEATRRIRARSDHVAKIPIVGVTAYAMEEDRARFVAAGMDAFVAKPLERDALHAAMAAMLAPSGPDKEDTMTTADEPQASSEIVDSSVLEEFAKALGAEQMDELLDKLDEDLRCASERTSAGAAARDADELASAVHAIKGLSGTLGAHALADVAKDMEQSARNGDVDGALARHDDLQRILSATLVHFAALREGSAA